MIDLTLNEYQQEAITTAVYPGKGGPLGLMYVALKMNGEAGEFAEHLGKAMRDEGYAGPLVEGLTDSRYHLLKKEIGDVLWYLAAGANELGITLSEIGQENLDKLKDRMQRGVISGSGDSR